MRAQRFEDMFTKSRCILRLHIVHFLQSPLSFPPGFYLTISGIIVERLEGDAESCDEAVALLVAKHPELEAVQIGDCFCFPSLNITDRGLQTLLAAIGLTKVSLSWAPFITGETLELPSTSVQHIKILALRYCSLTDEGLWQIMEIVGSQLTALDVTGSTITGEGFHILKDKFTNLEKVSLLTCRCLTNQGLFEILDMCGTKLQALNISGTPITGQGLDEMQGKFADLEALNLSRCLRLTDQGLSEILRLCGRKLHNLNISYTTVGSQRLEELHRQFADLKILRY